MLLEQILVGVYLLGCVGIGIVASQRAKGSRDEYWVAGRRVGTVVNSMAIMAALASGGSIIGVMGLAIELTTVPSRSAAWRCSAG